jgi:apolipoprotein D and lipocalin family protein
MRRFAQLLSVRMSSLALLSALGAPVLVGTATAAEVASVDALDIGRYAGEWHEIARLPMFFQRNCTGEITAQYTLREDGMVGVTNRCRNEDGEIDTVEGVARRDPDHPGRLEVRFAPDWLSWLPLTWADYWVIALDPDYQWAVVGEPGREYLWILSRTPDMPRERFDELKARAAAMGYDLEPLIVSAPLR